MSAVNFKSSHFKPREHWHCFHMKPTRNLALMGPLCFSHRWPFWTHRDLTQILCFRSSITITILCLTLSSSTTWHILFSPPCSHLPSSFPLHPNGLTLRSMLSFAIPSALASSPLQGVKGVINYAKSSTYEPSCWELSKMRTCFHMLQLALHLLWLMILQFYVFHLLSLLQSVTLLACSLGASPCMPTAVLHNCTF